VDNRHLAMWRGPSSTQRQARGLISGPSLTAKTRLLSFNGTQSGVVTGLLTGHDTLRIHLHLMGLTSSSLCRKCGAEDETSLHILCVCVKLCFHSDMHSWVPFSWTRRNWKSKSGDNLGP
jgi:hypothetical protein